MALWIRQQEFGAKSNWQATFAAPTNRPRPARTITRSFISTAARPRRCGAIRHSYASSTATASASSSPSRGEVGGPPASGPNSTPRCRPNRMCSIMLFPTSPSAGMPRRRKLALLGVSMGGQGALRMAYKYPNIFPTVAAISPAIDFQKRIDEGVDPGPRIHVPRCRGSAARLGSPPHPSAQLAAEPVLLLRSDRLSLARLGRPPANEAQFARRAVRMRPGNRSRRPQLRVREPHGPARRWFHRHNDSTRNAAASSSDCVASTTALVSRALPVAAAPSRHRSD